MISSSYENKFPDCLFVKLHGEIVSASENCSSFNNPNDISNQIQLKLTIRFGEQQWQEEDVTVNFGLKSGKLNLKLSNSNILMETLGLTPQFQTVYEIERSTEKSDAKGSDKAITTKPGVTFKRNKVSTEAIKFTDKIYQVHSKGTEEEISYIFQLETSEPILQGILQAEKIGNIEVTSKPCQIEATFEIEHIQITKISGIPNQYMSRERAALIEMEFLENFFKPQLLPYISRAELLYEEI